MSNIEIKKENKHVPQNKFIDQINLYYEIKEKYKDEYDTKIKKLLKEKKLDMQSKKKKLQEFRMKCIFCKRKVNTIFSKKNKTLSIRCGSQETPCNQKFELKIVDYTTMDNILIKLEEVMNKAKTSIIKIKTELLYNYLTNEEAIQNLKRSMKS